MSEVLKEIEEWIALLFLIFGVNGAFGYLAWCGYKYDVKELTYSGLVIIILYWIPWCTIFFLEFVEKIKKLFK